MIDECWCLHLCFSSMSFLNFHFIHFFRILYFFGTKCPVWWNKFCKIMNIIQLFHEVDVGRKFRQSWVYSLYWKIRPKKSVHLVLAGKLGSCYWLNWCWLVLISWLDQLRLFKGRPWTCGTSWVERPCPSSPEGQAPHSENSFF